MKNKLVVIVLLICVFGLTGYIVYDKVLSNENDNSDTNNSSDNNSVIIQDVNLYDYQNLMDARYDTVVFGIENGSKYDIFYMNTEVNGYFDNVKVERLGSINEKVVKVKLFSIGLDPSVTLFLITDDGKVYSSNFVSNEFKLVEDLQSYNVTDIKNVSKVNVQDDLKTEYIIVDNGTREQKVISK